MKKLLTAIAIAGFLVCPGVISAAYIIHLRDGRDFVTGQYSEEGDQIRFKRYGGLIGIRKDLVREIEEVADLPDKKKTPAAKPEVPAIGLETSKKEKAGERTAKAEAPKQERADQANKAKGKEQKIPLAASEEKEKKAVEIEMFLEEKRQLMWEIEGATSAFKEAKAKNDRVKKDKYWKKRLLLKEELTKLRERVISGNGGTLPAWWDSER